MDGYTGYNSLIIKNAKTQVCWLSIILFLIVTVPAEQIPPHRSRGEHTPGAKGRY